MKRDLYDYEIRDILKDLPLVLEDVVTNKTIYSSTIYSVKIMLQNLEYYFKEIDK